MTVAELIKILKELEQSCRVVINGNDVVMVQDVGNEDTGEEVVELVY